MESDKSDSSYSDIEGDSGDGDLVEREEGHGIQIVVADEEHNFELDEEALGRILLQDDIKNLPVVVISVAGAFRKGKSFILDFFIRYFRSKDKTDSSWMGGENEPLKGFSWRGGKMRDTTGILLWSEVFKVTTPAGEEIAVLLMDTQGTFDRQSTMRDCATIFALSTMTSSVQIYNLAQNIQEDNLQHLQVFTEYGRLALEDVSDTPFQKLVFLIRDWSYPYDAPFGAEGGKQILEDWLKVSETEHEELQSLRKDIRSCFSDISCFLMPYPGTKVATNPSFDGRLSDIENEFKTHLKSFVPSLLSAENLVVKRIGGQKVRAKELLYYFQAYMNIFKGNEVPEPKTVFYATAEANNLSAVASAKDLYSSAMKEVCGGNKPFLSSAKLEEEHLRCKKTAVSQFQARRKYGRDEFSIRFLEALEKEMEEEFENFKAMNESKNVFKTAKTPATLILICVIAYILWGIFGMIGLYSFANMFYLIMGSTLVLLGIWAYVRYSGEMRDIGNKIDTLAEVTWEYAFKPIFVRTASKLATNSIEIASNQMMSGGEGFFAPKVKTK